ncbi:MAG: hypothetical protein R2939_18925 [Kofleriaceae bacterium]
MGADARGRAAPARPHHPHRDGEHRVRSAERLRGASFEDDFKLYVQMSARLDEGTLSRFWGSLNQPVRPALQIWTLVPILPEKLEPFSRVQTRTLGYRNLTDPSQVDPDGQEHGPAPTSIARRRRSSPPRPPRPPPPSRCRHLPAAAGAPGKRDAGPGDGGRKK